ncbi:MAG: ABC transporter substrate-binding protein [Succinivibrionaceae bacterium]
MVFNKISADDKLRIISLSPEITELIYELNSGDDLIGIDYYSNYPSNTKTKEIVGDAYTTNIEKIITLHPTHIFLSASYNSFNTKSIEIIKQHIRDTKIISYDMSSFNLFLKNIEDLGKEINQEKNSKILKNNLQNKLNEIKTKYQNYPMKNIGIITWTKPIIAVGNNIFLNEAISICNAHNIFLSEKISYPIISNEKLFITKFDLLISLNTDIKKLPYFIQNKTKIVRGVYDDILSRVTPRTINIGIDFLCKIIQNEE